MKYWLKKTVEFYLKSSIKWIEGNIQEKRSIHKLWFTDKISYDKKKHHYRTFSEHPILALVKRKATLSHKKSGTTLSRSAVVHSSGEISNFFRELDQLSFD